MDSTKAAVRMALTLVIFGQLGIAQPGRAPDDAVPAIEAATEKPASRSDAHRLVGKVLAVDSQSGIVKLSTDSEGVRDIKAPATLVRAIRVGDTISVIRSSDDGVSASPR